MENITNFRQEHNKGNEDTLTNKEKKEDKFQRIKKEVEMIKMHAPSLMSKRANNTGVPKRFQHPTNDADNLHDLFITSQTKILSYLSSKPLNVTHTGRCLIQEANEVWIGVARANDLKCERCRNYSTKVGSYFEHPALYNRCHDVVAFQSHLALEAVSVAKKIKRWRYHRSQVAYWTTG